MGTSLCAELRKGDLSVVKCWIQVFGVRDSRGALLSASRVLFNVWQDFVEQCKIDLESERNASQVIEVKDE